MKAELDLCEYALGWRENTSDGRLVSGQQVWRQEHRVAGLEREPKDLILFVQSNHLL